MGFSRRWSLVALPVVILLLHTLLSYIGVIGTGFFHWGASPKGDALPPSLPELPPTLPVVRVAELESEADRNALLLRVINKNAAARKQIRSLVIDQEFTKVENLGPDFPLPADLVGQDIRTRATLHVVRDGESFFARHFVDKETVSGSPIDEREYQGGANPSYIATYEKYYKRVEVHDEPASIAPTSLTAPKGWLARGTAMDYAFRIRSIWLDEFYDRTRERETWTIEDAEIDGDPVYRLVAARPTSLGPSNIQHIYIDPNRDYLIRRHDYFQLEVNHLEEGRLELALDATSGRWYPRSVYFRDNHSTDSTLELNVTSIAINLEIDDKVFDLASMKFRGDAIMERFAPGSKRAVRYRIANGEWVPIQLQ